MSNVTRYLETMLENVQRTNAHQPEFLQAVSEVLNPLRQCWKSTLWLFIDAGILDRLVEPDRMIRFRVAWVDDNGRVRVNIGYRVQFCNAIGPYKGGLRFHPSVYDGIIKFLGFEQIFKNSLTVLPIGAARRQRFRSKRQVRRRDHAFLPELHDRAATNILAPIPMCRQAISAWARAKSATCLGSISACATSFPAC